MPRQADAAFRQQAPEIDQVGANQQCVGRQWQRLAATDAVDRLIDAKNEVLGKGLGDALGAPADAAAGIEDQRRSRLPSVTSRQCSGEGIPVVVKNRFAERMREVATNQFVEAVVRPVLRADDDARVAAHAASGSSPRMPAAISAASMSCAALIGRRRW